MSRGFGPGASQHLANSRNCLQSSDEWHYLLSEYPTLKIPGVLRILTDPAGEHQDRMVPKAPGEDSAVGRHQCNLRRA